MSIRSEAYFAIIPEWVLYADISPQALRLYAVLNRYAGKENKAHPSRKALADKMRVSVKTVDRSLDELETIGAVQVEHRIDEFGDQTSNQYLLKVSPPGPKADAPPGDKDDATPGDTDDARNESHLEREPSEPEKTLAKRTNRPRDLLFEAVAEACDINITQLTRSARGQLNAAVSEIRGAGAEPDEVRQRASNWPYDGATLTPSALAKHWPQLERARPPNKPKDRFVDMHSSLEQRLAAQRQEVNGGQIDQHLGEARSSLPPGPRT